MDGPKQKTILTKIDLEKIRKTFFINSDPNSKLYSKNNPTSIFNINSKLKLLF